MRLAAAIYLIGEPVEQHSSVLAKPNRAEKRRTSVNFSIELSVNRLQRNDRIRLLEPVRRIADEKLDEDEKQRWCEKYTVHYARLVDFWYDRWFNNEGGQYLPIFSADAGNVFVAGSYLHEAGDTPQLQRLISLATDSATLFGWTGRSRWGIELLHLATAAAEKINDTEGLANCYRNLGELYFLMSENERAQQEFERAIPLYQQVGDKLGLANTQYNMGLYWIRLNEVDKGKEMILDAVSYYEQLPHFFNAAVVLENLADAMPEKNNKDKRTWLKKAADYFRRMKLESDARRCEEKLQKYIENSIILLNKGAVSKVILSVIPAEAKQNAGIS